MPLPSPPVRTDRRLPPPLIDSPAFVVMQAGRLVFERLIEALDPFNVSVAAVATMAVSKRLGPMTQSALADRVGVSEALMTAILDGMEWDALMWRRPHPTDRRRRVVSLNETGEEVLGWAEEGVAAVDSFLLHHVGREGLARLATLAPEEVGPVARALGVRRGS